MPIQRTKRPITLDEHAKWTAPTSELVTPTQAIISLIGRGGCLLGTLLIAALCVVAAILTPTLAQIMLIIVAVWILFTGVKVAWPLPSILVAAKTGRERVVPGMRLPRNDVVETWVVPARRIFATDFIGDDLTWLIESDDGEQIVIWGEDDFVEPDAGWIPGQFTLRIVDEALMFNSALEGPVVPYIWLSDEAKALLKKPFVSGYEVLTASEVAKLKPLREAAAARHAAQHGTLPPSP